MAIYRAVVLRRLNEPSDYTMEVALRAQVPQDRRPFYADGNRVSAWTGEEDQGMIDGLKSGLYTERVIRIEFGSEPSEQEIAQRIQAEWTAFQAHTTAYNPWTYYGSRWDGTSWTVVRIN